MNKINEKTQKSDYIILERLKKSLNMDNRPREEKMILEDKKIMQMLEIMEQRKNYIYSLFDSGFTIKEQEIKNEIFNGKSWNSEKTYLDILSDRILNKIINKTFEQIMNDNHLDSWTKVVAMDRRIFINFLLEGTKQRNKHNEKGNRDGEER